MISQYEVVENFRYSSLIYIARLRTRLWIICILIVSFNLRLNYILGFSRSFSLLLSLSLLRSGILSSDLCPPTLLCRRDRSDFLWYLHLFRCIARRISRFHNTIIICECIGQITCIILQIYYLLNWKFSLLCAGI
jgi:hypothetical protein